MCLAALAPCVAAQRLDTVRVGSGALRGAELQTGTYTIESFRRTEGRDTPISTTTQSIMRERQAGVDVYVIRSTHAATEGDTTIGITVARASDFALLHHRVHAPHDSAAVTVADGYVTAWVVLPDEPIRLIDQRLRGPVFPIEGQVPWLFPLLPLADGYGAVVPHYSEWEGTEQWSTLRVLDGERITLNGRALECWKVDGVNSSPATGSRTGWTGRRDGSCRAWPAAPRPVPSIAPDSRRDEASAPWVRPPRSVILPEGMSRASLILLRFGPDGDSLGEMGPFPNQVYDVRVWAIGARAIRGPATSRSPTAPQHHGTLGHPFGARPAERILGKARSHGGRGVP
jgi:hypothetical protein